MTQVIDIAKIGWTKEQIMEWLQKEVCEIPELCSVDLEEDSKTNADHIRAMNEEELADFLCKVKSDYQWLDHEFPSEEESEEWVEWLQSEVEE